MLLARVWGGRGALCPVFDLSEAFPLAFPWLAPWALFSLFSGREIVRGFSCEFLCEESNWGAVLGGGEAPFGTPPRA